MDRVTFDMPNIRAAACEKHGEYDSTMHPRRNPNAPERWTGCPKCADEAAGNSAESRRAAQDQARVENYLKTCNVPLRFAGAQFSDVQSDRILTWFDAAKKGESRGALVLAGTVGTGKSHQACSILRGWIEQVRRPGYYVTASEYARDIRSTWSRDSELSERAVMRRPIEAPFLVIDDLGAGKAQDVDLLQELICARYDDEMMGTLVVSTNLAPKAWDQAFGERVTDRLREGATLVEMAGRSLRRPAA